MREREVCSAPNCSEFYMSVSSAYADHVMRVRLLSSRESAVHASRRNARFARPAPAGLGLMCHGTTYVIIWMQCNAGCALHPLVLRSCPFTAVAVAVAAPPRSRPLSPPLARCFPVERTLQSSLFGFKQQNPLSKQQAAANDDE